MASLIDFAIAVGIFFVTVAVVISLVINFYGNFLGVSSSSELRTSAFNILNTLLAKGIPTDWENRNIAPVRVGLATDLHRIPLIVTNINTTDFSNQTINFTIGFDPTCSNSSWETTVRIFNESNDEYQFNLYNQSYCSLKFLRQSDIVLNMSLAAGSSEKFFAYFSGEMGINETVFPSIEFPTDATNHTVKTFPRETVKSLSVGKLFALRNLTYGNVLETFGSNTRFQIEISDR